MLKNILNQILVVETEFKYPSVINSILVTFSVFGQKGGIIGGAVRDFVLKKEIRDFDVYIESTTQDRIADRNELRIQASRFGYALTDITADSEYTGGSIINVYCLSKEDSEETIDVIFGEASVEDHVGLFTLGLSKLWYDVQSGETLLYQDFIKAVNSKVCGIFNRRGSHPAEIEIYTNKIRKKYPEFKFIEEPFDDEYINS